MMKKFEITLEQAHDTKIWHCYCPDLKISVEANTPRHAVYMFAGALRRIKKEIVEKGLQL